MLVVTVTSGLRPQLQFQGFWWRSRPLRLARGRRAGPGTEASRLWSRDNHSSLARPGCRGWSGNASRQHKMWYYNKCTVHVLVESVERPLKCFILTGSVILSQPPGQEDSVLLTWTQTTSTTTRELWVGVCAGDSVLFMGLCPCVSRLVLQKIPSEGS